ncbi:MULTISPECIES: YhgE/Pip domain-containing protein [unclassified Mesobacillus]|uniref:YhgE/Pip domain-containing protein n=1 Tax=unclassified Mesobacillus TaxID=2675270 RepID=UPI00203DA864|nr:MULTISPECIES: YhgE/Pip domain-containing protein [unclassified Mesobacillus]MCM3124915.1 YhgE/Pip domain-containing protein [Mesobacillus sp. MER 33]MCM3232776.1 YhgE/Pip domain-containing protein [Mesobacillus sp. MER 48]
MNWFSLFLAQMSQLASSKGVLYSVIAALLVPIVYGGILLSPDWGPYDNLSNLPVAIVNNDKGAISGDEPLNVGEDLVADLKKSNDLGWKFVDSEEAEEGLRSFKYYMVIEIPQDFSERVTTVLEPDPKRLELNYIQNEGLNFMAAQVTKSATEKLREKLANKITEKYANNIFASLGEVSDGFKTAADGSAQLHDGTAALQDGTGLLLTSLNEKSADISKLAAGTLELKSGTGQLAGTLAEKQGSISELANGSKELAAGTAQLAGSLKSKQSDITKLANGSKDLKNGTGLLLSSLNEKSADITKLADGSADVNAGTGLLLQKLKDGQPGITQLAAGGKQLEEKMPELKAATSEVLAGLQAAQQAVKVIGPGTKEVADGIGEVITNSQNLGSNLQNLTVLIESYLAKNPSLATDKEFLTILGTSRGIRDAATKPENATKLQELKDGADQIAAAFNEKIPAEQGSLASGITQLAEGQKLINNGVADLAAKAPALSAGTASVAAGWDEMITKVGLLHDGTSQIAAGNKSVNAGWGTITAGVKELDGGAALISAGNQTVDKGWKELAAGATKIHSGAAQVSDGNAAVDNGWRELTAGASKIHSGVVQVSDGNVSVEKGWGDLTDGVTKLNDGAGKLYDGSGELAAGLKDGAEETGKIKANEKNIGMFASPVELISNKVNGYSLYRDSSAPYVMTLALFVGILIMSMFINFNKPQELNVSKVGWFAVKFLNLASLAVVQAILLSIVVLAFLGLQVTNPVGFIMFAILVSIVFAAIVMFFASFGNIGRFILFALVVMQLSTTGSNLPIDMLPENLRSLSAYLPFTYSIAGFKALISLNDFSMALRNLGVLLGFLILFALMTVTVYLFKTKEQPQHTDLAM